MFNRKKTRLRAKLSNHIQTLSLGRCVIKSRSFSISGSQFPCLSIGNGTYPMATTLLAVFERNNFVRKVLQSLKSYFRGRASQWSVFNVHIKTTLECLHMQMLTVPQNHQCLEDYLLSPTMFASPINTFRASLGGIIKLVSLLSISPSLFCQTWYYPV